MAKLVTSHVWPPIPDRRFDWCAYWDNEVESQHYYGWGPTEAEAIADLRRLDQERAEDNEESEAGWFDPARERFGSD